VKQRDEERRIQEEFEKKRKEFLENDTYDVDAIMKKLEEEGVNNNEYKNTEIKKKKKKKKK
jgi:hypothetical protein